MPQLARSESASAGLRLLLEALDAAVVAGDRDPELGRVRRPAWSPGWRSRRGLVELAHRGQVDVGERVAGDHQEGVAEEVGGVADAARGPEQTVLAAVGELDSAGRPVAEVPLDQLREPVQVGDRLDEAVAAEQAQDVLHHRPVEDRDHRLRHLVGDRPQPRAQPRRQDHRPHGWPIASLKRSIDSTGTGSTPCALGQLERDQVAQHHRPEQPLDPGLALGLDPDRAGTGGLDGLGGELDAAALARVLVAVLEEDGGELGLRRLGPSSRRSRCGRPPAARSRRQGSLAFSLTWVFQRRATGAVRSAP